MDTELFDPKDVSNEDFDYILFKLSDEKPCRLTFAGARKL